MVTGNLRRNATLKDDHRNIKHAGMNNIYFDRHLRIGFFFDFSYYVRDIGIQEVEDDGCQKVWRWWGTDNLLPQHRRFIFELLGEKDDDGRMLVNDEMFLNVVDEKTKKLVKQIAQFDIEICY